MKLLTTLIFTSICLTTYADNNNTPTTAKSRSTHNSTAKSTTKTTTKATTTSVAKTTTRKSSRGGEVLTIADSVDCDDGTPCIVVSSTSREVLREINERQGVSNITDTVTPHFDFRLMTKYALGHNWKEATEEQQDQLVTLFRQLLIFTYSTALSKFGGAKIYISSSAINPNGRTATVVSQVSLSSSATNNTNQPVKVEYNLANTTGVWMAYDIKIENASLVTTYRNQFNDIVKTSKIDGLIKQLQSKVNSLKRSKVVDDR